MFDLNKLHPFPVLTTQRLHLKQMTEEDAADFFEFRSDKETMKFIPRDVAVTVEDVLPLMKMMNEGWEKKEKINWGIYLKETNKLIGFVGYVYIYESNHRAEVGYMLNKAYHRQGYTFEALKAVVDFGFNIIAFHSIDAVINPLNIPSEGVLRKMNFKKEAHFRESFLIKGKFEDAVHYCILKSDF